MVEQMSLILVNNTATVSFGLFMVLMILKLRNTPKAQSLPGLMVNLGILGTFLGIFLALLNFNVSDIQGSIPEFLGGIKTAFSTSILGMFFSINMKIFPGIITSNQHNLAEENEDVGTALIVELKKSNENIKKSNEYNVSMLSKLINALSGEGETTLITQIQKLRTTTADKLDNLQGSFDHFAEKVSDLGSKALIEALSGVIKDFNSNITEQFGDNFKQLNEGVGKMLDWQQQYKTHVETLTAHFAMAADGIRKSEISLEKISQSHHDVLDMAKSFNPLLEEINQQREEIQQTLGAFSDLSENAKNTFPIIQKNLNLLMDNMSNHINEFSASQQEALKKSTDEIFKLVNKMEAQIEGNINSQYEVLKQQLEKFDGALGDSLTKSLDSFGRAFASISAKFIDDYLPLTEKLQKIVKIAEGVNGTRIAS